MRINNITNNNFEGKLFISSYITSRDNSFVQEILNYRVNGISNR